MLSRRGLEDLPGGSQDAVPYSYECREVIDRQAELAFHPDGQFHNGQAVYPDIVGQPFVVLHRPARHFGNLFPDKPPSRFGDACKITAYLLLLRFRPDNWRSSLPPVIGNMSVGLYPGIVEAFKVAVDLLTSLHFGQSRVLDEFDRNFSPRPEEKGIGAEKEQVLTKIFKKRWLRTACPTEAASPQAGCPDQDRPDAGDIFQEVLNPGVTCQILLRTAAETTCWVEQDIVAGLKSIGHFPQGLLDTAFCASSVFVQVGKGDRPDKLHDRAVDGHIGMIGVSQRPGLKTGIEDGYHDHRIDQGRVIREEQDAGPVGFPDRLKSFHFYLIAQAEKKTD
ncbi:MAG: hypothetical protein A4E66_02431 [Syntrophus sp. PtaB.Bin001]|nr:MAG: hypothetical protein A4E66_02431 [Syntrophus sp. PtaB.Bin001]